MFDKEKLEDLMTEAINIHKKCLADFENAEKIVKCYIDVMMHCKELKGELETDIRWYRKQIASFN